MDAKNLPMNSSNQKRSIVTVKNPPAHGEKQALLYSALELPGIREIWICAGTKFGKTLGATIAQIIYAIKRPNTKHRWVAPIYSQTRQPLEYFRKILPPSPHLKENKSENTLRLPKINTRFEFWHAQNPSSLEGDGIHSYVFDEAARQPPEIRASAKTTVTRTKGPMIFISYPYGKNWFHDGCMEAREEMLWAYKKGMPPEKVFFHARTMDNPTIDPATIEAMRKELSSKQFRQFVKAEFLEDGAVFSDYSDCLFGDLIETYGDIQQWIAPTAKYMHVCIGADWAKTNDYTVFVAINMEYTEENQFPRGHVCGFMRFHKRKYSEAVRKLGVFARKFGGVEMILHDKTGVGIAIDELIAYIGFPYRGVTFTNELKSEFVLKLTTGFEQKQVGICRWPELIKELKAYEGKPNKIGTITYGAASGSHDDIVTALFLAYYLYLLYADTEFEVKDVETLGTQINEPTELEKYYLDVADDDD